MQLKQDDEMSGVVRLTAAELDEEAMENLHRKCKKMHGNLPVPKEII